MHHFGIWQKSYLWKSMFGIKEQQLLDVLLIEEGCRGARQKEGCQVQGSKGCHTRAALPSPKHLMHQPLQGPLLPVQGTPAFTTDSPLCVITNREHFIMVHCKVHHFGACKFEHISSACIHHYYK